MQKKKKKPCVKVVFTPGEEALIDEMIKEKKREIRNKNFNFIFFFFLQILNKFQKIIVFFLVKEVF
jgi:hypothetical protein